MIDLRDLDAPIVQAGMGGVARHELAASVSEAGGLGAVAGAAAPLIGRIPPALQARAIAAQRPWQPFLSPQPPTDDGPASLVDSGPLYAGSNVGRITDVRPAAELVAALTP